MDRKPWVKFFHSVLHPKKINAMTEKLLTLYNLKMRKTEICDNINAPFLSNKLHRNQAIDAFLCII